MRKDIQWRPRFWGQSLPFDSRQIDAIEEMWGVELPKDYIRTVAAFQGMAPQPGVFKVEEGDDVFDVLLTLEPQEGKEYYSIPEVHRLLQPHLPAGVYPFASTPGGQFLCFDYRSSAEHPKVVLATVEMLILSVANSFQELMESLYDIEP